MNIKPNVRTSIFLRALGVLAIVALVLTFGVWLRLEVGRSTLAANNLAIYYFDKFQRLATDGRLPRSDIWEFAPGPHPENAPPGFVYISWVLYELLRRSGLTLTMLQFADLLPVIIWAIGSVFAFLAVWLIERKVVAAILVTAVFALVRPMVFLTAWGNYTQETAGVFLMFFSIYFFSHLWRPVSRAFFAVGAASIALLILTWQQFPVFYVAAAGLAAMAFAFKESRAALRGLALLGSALIVAETINKVFVQNAYSALSMIREYAIGFWQAHLRTPDFICCMVRNDWGSVPWARFPSHFGPLASALFIIGFSLAVLFFTKWRYRTFLFFGMAGLILFHTYEKEQNVALGMALPVIVLGAITVLSRREVDSFLERVNFIWSGIRKIPRWPFAVLAAILVGAAILIKLMPSLPPKPDVSFASAEGPDGKFTVTVRLKNLGGLPFYPSGIFPGLTSGVHVELQNAIIDSYKANFPLTQLNDWPYYTYSYARLGNTYFVEAKFKSLKYGEIGEVVIKGRAEDPKFPVKAYYRGWMPINSCIQDFTERERRLGQLPKNGWEPCVARMPANDDSAHEICPIRVFSGRGALQDFRCLNTTL